ncbi:MAG: methylenetetrahydrofolate reductase [NAD(P)H] [Deltaproteobacteria bacterium]|nr:methylenetetrahydrofolate reductase [NAD(P)H] [Deltaproteobacteria bacterium]
MNFRDFYQKGKPQFSFEIFPPKNEAGFQDLLTAMRDLSRFHPAFISVTYGAMGTTQALTRDLALRIYKELNLTTAFHFTCVGSDRESIQSYVEQLKREGINLIVALRGDPPEGTEKFVPKEDGFRYAAQLVHFLKELGGFSIAVAGYPEGHVEAPDLETDLMNLKLKVQAGADIVITQLFFDNRDFFNFQNRARQIGINVPIIPGIMPIVNLKQIEKITRMCGASIPEELRQELLRNESNPEAIREIGIQHAIEQSRELIERGSPGIHFYTLNKSYSVGKVVQSL